MRSGPSFHIPARPEREFPYSGGVEYQGETVFVLAPSSDQTTDRLERLVDTVLEEGPYRYGDFLNLPMLLYLVRDEETTDVFRVSVRDGTVRLHVLPETEPDGLHALYTRLDDETAWKWHVDCRTTVDLE